MNNEPDVSDELKVLASIYCKDGEFLLDEESYGLGELSFTVNLEDVGKMISFSCQLNKDYPTSLPILHVSRPTLKRSEFESFRKDLTAFLETNSLINQPMLTELIEWVRRHVANYETSSHQLAAEMKQLPTASTHLLQLDHMRSKSKYISLLRTWAKDLNLTGGVLFIHNMIFILLHGQKCYVKKFIMQLRTQKVDVDSSGRPCKERMLKVIGEFSGLPCSVSQFEVIHFQTDETFKLYFKKAGLSMVFLNILEPFVGKG
ncbi:RWD domain-containing protein 3-like [Clavelina lepadiformis]|uniref:RWD domain-containing protein 3-like n=1 Tax=Clavelina lepadiformis TaxID=159417 RepID=UPI00404368F0